jgi:hypothetical protein
MPVSCLASTLQMEATCSSETSVDFQRTRRDNSVGIATGYGLDGHGSIPRKNKRIFSTSQPPDRFWGPPILRREADLSPPSITEVKNGGALPPLLHMSS